MECNAHCSLGYDVFYFVFHVCVDPDYFLYLKYRLLVLNRKRSQTDKLIRVLVYILVTPPKHFEMRLGYALPGPLSAFFQFEQESYSRTTKSFTFILGFLTARSCSHVSNMNETLYSIHVIPML